MKGRYFLLFLGLLLSPISPIHLGAQDTLNLTLEEAWGKFQSQNPTLQRLAIDVAALQREVDSSLKSWIPSASVGTGLSRSSPLLSALTNPQLPSESESSLWSLRGSLDLRLTINPSLNLETQAELLGLHLAELELQTQKQILWVSFQKAFYQILAQAKNLKVQEESLNLAKSRLEQIQTQFDRGLRSDLELLTARIAAARDVPALQRAKAEQTKQLRLLRQNLGLPPDSPLELVPPQPSAVTFTLSPEEIEVQLPRNLDLRKAQIRLEQGQVQRELSRSSRLGPALGLSLGWSSSLNPAFEAQSWAPDQWSDSWGLGLSLTIPLDPHIPGSSGQLALTKLDDEAEKLKLTLAETRQRVENEIRSLILDLEVSQSNLEMSRLSLRLQELNYQKVLESFDRGQASLLELEDARQALQEARLSLETEELNALFLRIDLRSKIGD